MKVTWLQSTSPSLVGGDGILESPSMYDYIYAIIGSLSVKEKGPKCNAHSPTFGVNDYEASQMPLLHSAVHWSECLARSRGYELQNSNRKIRYSGIFYGEV